MSSFTVLSDNHIYNRGLKYLLVKIRRADGFISDPMTRKDEADRQNQESKWTEGRNRIIRNAGHAVTLNLPADTDLASIDTLMRRS